MNKYNFLGKSLRLINKICWTRQTNLNTWCISSILENPSNKIKIKKRKLLTLDGAISSPYLFNAMTRALNASDAHIDFYLTLLWQSKQIVGGFYFITQKKTQKLTKIICFRFVSKTHTHTHTPNCISIIDTLQSALLCIENENIRFTNAI